MSIYLDKEIPDGARHNHAFLPCPKSAVDRTRPRPELAIGIVNNAQDGALNAMERQFLSILQASSQGISLRTSLFTLPGIARSDSARRHIEEHYSNFDSLPSMALDALIVTGREPTTPHLHSEPYWKDFVKLVDWARSCTISTVWSCLAAHAAVLHMDTISRTRQARKCCGVYECERVNSHSLTAGLSPHFRIPHSRWNGIEQHRLLEAGYQILTGADTIGVDTFIKHDKSLFLFFQGHPEYEADTLMLEYRRDVGRFLRGESAVYPNIPQGYFDTDTVTALKEIEEKSKGRDREGTRAWLSAVLKEATLKYSWRHTAMQIYSNWLHYLATTKMLQSYGANLSVDRSSQWGTPQ